MFSMFYTDDKKVIQEIDSLLESFIRHEFGDEYSVRSFDSVPFIPFIGINEKGSSKVSARYLLRHSPDIIEIDPYFRIWFRPSETKQYLIGISTVLKRRMDIAKRKRGKSKAIIQILNFSILYLGISLVGANLLAPREINGVVEKMYSLAIFFPSILMIYFWIKDKKK